MRLSEFTLSDNERTSLDEIFKSLTKDENTKDIIRAEFKLYIHSIRHNPLSSIQLARLLSNPFNSPYTFQVLLYDYSREHLFRAILNDAFHGICDANTTDQIKHLIVMRDRRTINAFRFSPQGGQLEYIKDFTQRVPTYFVNEFFGYRRSASIGSVIRFYIKLVRGDGDSQEVKFYNLYKRNNIEWHVRGFGIFLDNVLYLIGHAVDAEANKSLGMRMFVLRQDGTTNNICGIVLSMDRQFPIAARVLLIPIMHHNMAFNQEDDTTLYGQIFKDQLIRNIIISKQDDHDTVDKIFKDLDLDKCGIKSREKFSSYIENTTPTLLKAGMDLPFDIDYIGTQMHRLREYVLASGETRDLARVLGDEMAAAIEGYLGRFDVPHGG